jgi:hypothetical protein
VEIEGLPLESQSVSNKYKDKDRFHLGSVQRGESKGVNDGRSAPYSSSL